MVLRFHHMNRTLYDYISVQCIHTFTVPGTRFNSFHGIPFHVEGTSDHVHNSFRTFMPSSP